MNIKTLNSRIRSLLTRGFDRSDIEDLVDSVEGFGDIDEILTNSGYIKESTNQPIIDQIANKIPKWQKLKSTLAKTIAKDNFVGPRSDEQIANRFVDEYRAKRDFGFNMGKLHDQYYDLVQAVIQKLNLRGEDIEGQAIEKINNTVIGHNYLKGASNVGAAGYAFEKNKPSMSYWEANSYLNNIYALQSSDQVLDEVLRMHKRRGGII